MNLCSRNMHVYLPRPEVEAMLLGKVILDPEHEAQMMLLFEELEEGCTPKPMRRTVGGGGSNAAASVARWINRAGLRSLPGSTARG
jgi:hypothetical protein